MNDGKTQDEIRLSGMWLRKREVDRALPWLQRLEQHG